MKHIQIEPPARLFRRQCVHYLFASYVFLSAFSVHAQAYPSKPIKVIVPNTAGSLLDVITRIVLPSVATELGAVMIVENRVGAGGSIGTDSVAKSAPDGYTLLTGDTGVLTITPALYSKVGYNPLKDFTSIAPLTKTGSVLVVNPSLGVNNLADFVKLAKSKPGVINYASGGNGHPQHLLGEMFQRYSGTKLFHVPFKGGPAALQAVIAGDASANIVAPSDSLPHIRSGRVIALATIGPHQTDDALRDLPDIAQVYPGFNFAVWVGMFSPKGTPPEIVSKLNKAFTKAISLPDVRNNLAARGYTVVPGSPADLDQLLATDYERNQDMVKRLGLKVD